MSLPPRLGIGRNDVIAVGDGANDIPMLAAAGIGVALHAKPAVRRMRTVRIDHGDLTALLYLQGYRREEFALTSAAHSQLDRDEPHVAVGATALVTTTSIDFWLFCT